MSRYISKGGVWHVAKEKVGLINKSGKDKIVDGKRIKPGEPYVYDGPDRAGLLAIWQEHKGKSETLGIDFRKDPEFLQSIRTKGFKDLPEFLEFIGYDEIEEEKRFKKEAAQVTKHELPKAVKAIEQEGGGIDTSGGGLDRSGGFGSKPNE